MIFYWGTSKGKPEHIKNGVGEATISSSLSNLTTKSNVKCVAWPHRAAPNYTVENWKRQKLVSAVATWYKK